MKKRELKEWCGGDYGASCFTDGFCSTRWRKWIRCTGGQSILLLLPGSTWLQIMLLMLLRPFMVSLSRQFCDDGDQKFSKEVALLAWSFTQLIGSPAWTIGGLRLAHLCHSGYLVVVKESVAWTRFQFGFYVCCLTCSNLIFFMLSLRCFRFKVCFHSFT